jgi:cobalt-zinc-cadmium efflux system outer membrane protein
MFIGGHSVNRFLVFIAFVAAAVAAEAQGQAPTRLTLDEALRLFAQNSPELALARARVDEAAGLARQAGAFPNPALSGSHEPLSAPGRSYSESYVNLTQRIELPGQRGTRAQAAGRARDAALARLAADSTRLAFEVKRAWVEAALAGERRGITEGVTQVFRRASVQASDRLGQGDISRYDRRRIDVERARYENLSADATLDAAVAERALAALIAPAGEFDAATPSGMTAALPPPVAPSLLERATAQRRAELAAAEAEVDAARAHAALARAERLPDLTATAGFKRQSDGLEGGFLGLSIPVPLFDRGSGGVAATDARVQAAEGVLALTRRSLDNDVRRAVDAYRSLQRRADLLGAAERESADLLEIADVAYDAGEMELVELLDAADAHQQARAAEVRLRAQLWIAYFDLERALGGFDATAAAATENDR